MVKLRVEVHLPQFKGENRSCVNLNTTRRTKLIVSRQLESSRIEFLRISTNYWKNELTLRNFFMSLHEGKPSDWLDAGPEGAPEERADAHIRPPRPPPRPPKTPPRFPRPPQGDAPLTFPPEDTLWSKSRSPQALEEELTLEETGYAPVRRIPASRRPAHPVHTSKGVKGKGNGERYIKGDWMKGEPIVVRQHNEHRCWRQERNERTGEIMDVHICESCGWLSCTLHRSIKPPRGWIVIP
jgi:hypothetical protein